MAMLEVKDLHVHYGVIEALKGINLEVNEGEIVSLIGANGAGKTTMMQSISGIKKKTSGDILFLGDIIESSTVWKGLKQWDAIKWIVEKVELRVNSKRNYIYKEIHEPMRDMLKKLKGFDGFIIKYYKNEYSLDFILRTLDKFQKQQKLFGIEEDNTQFTVYADFYDNMDHNIETFRSSIIYKCDPEYLPRRTEIMSKLKRIPD